MRSSRTTSDIYSCFARPATQPPATRLWQPVSRHRRTGVFTISGSTEGSTDLTARPIIKLTHWGQQQTGGGEVCCLQLHISGNQFRGVAELEYLLLSDNRLTELGDQAFHGLTLGRLELANNPELRRIADTAFQSARLLSLVMVGCGLEKLDGITRWD